MQAVILAAGKGTRMKDLSISTPKPMLKVLGKTLLEHKFDILLGKVDEIILVVGYHADLIRDTYQESYKGMKLRYVVQEELDGTMGALLCAKHCLSRGFVVMMGDDIYSSEDLEAVCASSDWSMLVFETSSMASGGKIIVGKAGEVIDIEEGDHQGTPGIMNTNMMKLDTRLFGFASVPKAVGSLEYGLPQTVLAASKEGAIPLHAVRAKKWIQITSPEDISRAEKELEDIEVESKKR